VTLARDEKELVALSSKPEQRCDDSQSGENGKSDKPPGRTDARIPLAHLAIGAHLLYRGQSDLSRRIWGPSGFVVGTEWRRCRVGGVHLVSGLPLIDCNAELLGRLDNRIPLELGRSGRRRRGAVA